jgi:hypothetical protein
MEATVIDRDNPRENHEIGEPIRCPECHSTLLERVKVIQYMAPEHCIARAGRAT